MIRHIRSILSMVHAWLLWYYYTPFVPMILTAPRQCQVAEPLQAEVEWVGTWDVVGLGDVFCFKDLFHDLICGLFEYLI